MVETLAWIGLGVLVVYIAVRWWMAEMNYRGKF